MIRRLKKRLGLTHCYLCNGDHETWQCWLPAHREYAGRFWGLLRADPELETAYLKGYSLTGPDDLTPEQAAKIAAIREWAWETTDKKTKQGSWQK